MPLRCFDIAAPPRSATFPRPRTSPAPLPRSPPLFILPLLVVYYGRSLAFIYSLPPKIALAPNIARIA